LAQARLSSFSAPDPCSRSLTPTNLQNDLLVVTMEDGFVMVGESGGLSPEQQGKLTLFREVVADGRDAKSATQLLQSCNWNVEQALQLHWATADEEGAAATNSASSSLLGAVASGSSSSPGAAGAPNSSDGHLGTPLLTREEGAQHTEGGAVAMGSSSPVQMPARLSLLSWLSRGLRRIGVSVLSVLCTFIFGPGGPQLAGGQISGAAFSRALMNAYGAQLQLPTFFEGSFTQAFQAARRDLKLLVIYLHSENSRYTQSFCTQVLNNEFIRTMLDENFLLWGGDIARMETHQVSQMIHARQYPMFCVVLPVSVSEIRVIGSLHGEVQLDAAVALLAACLEEMEMHRAEIVARREQQVEDRHLREQQDREYQEALEMDRKREEEQQVQEREQAEAQRVAEEERRQMQEALDRQEAQKRELEERRRRQAATLEVADAEAKSRISLRLPAGQRVQRTFRSTATLADVYAWADSVAYLSENAGKGLEIPAKFTLKTSFPSRDLTEMERTIEELQLSGSNILLAAIEDDE